jgi:fatty acid desaturase
VAEPVFRPVSLFAAILVTAVVWAVGGIPWWLAVPLLMFFGAASLAGLMGRPREADR